MSEIAMVQTTGIDRIAVVDLVMLSFPEETKIKSKRRSIPRSLEKFSEGDDAIYALEDVGTVTILNMY